jgi:hypothetical protein
VASKDLFNFAQSPNVTPIVCHDCGNNMHCIRRQQVADGERQTFMCAACGSAAERLVGLQPSDAAIQAEAEKRSGVAPRP